MAEQKEIRGQERFDEEAAKWDLKPAPRAVAKELVPWLLSAEGILPESNAKVVDIGAGTGLVSLPLVESGRVSALAGIDLSEGMIRAFASKLQRAREEGNVSENVAVHPLATLLENVDQMPAGLQANEVELIVSSLTFHHVEKPVELLKLCRQLLVPGKGKLVIVDLFRDEGGQSIRFHPKDVHVECHGFSKEEMTDLFLKAGWDASELELSTPFEVRQKVVDDHRGEEEDAGAVDEEGVYKESFPILRVVASLRA